MLVGLAVAAFSPDCGDDPLFLKFFESGGHVILGATVHVLAHALLPNHGLAEVVRADAEVAQAVCGARADATHVKSCQRKSVPRLAILSFSWHADHRRAGRMKIPNCRFLNS